MLEGFILPCQEISAEMLDTTDEMLQMTDFEHLKALNAVKLTNNYIAENHGDLSMFATLFFGVLNSHNGLLSYILSYINGGHEPVVIINRFLSLPSRSTATSSTLGQGTLIEPGIAALR